MKDEKGREDGGRGVRELQFIECQFPSAPWYISCGLGRRSTRLDRCRRATVSEWWVRVKTSSLVAQPLVVK